MIHSLEKNKYSCCIFLRKYSPYYIRVLNYIETYTFLNPMFYITEFKLYGNFNFVFTYCIFSDKLDRNAD